MENGHRNSWFLPIKNCDVPLCFLYVYQNVWPLFCAKVGKKSGRTWKNDLMFLFVLNENHVRSQKNISHHLPLSMFSICSAYCQGDFFQARLLLVTQSLDLTWGCGNMLIAKTFHWMPWMCPSHPLNFQEMLQMGLVPAPPKAWSSGLAASLRTKHHGAISLSYCQ